MRRFPVRLPRFRRLVTACATLAVLGAPATTPAVVLSQVPAEGRADDLVRRLESVPGLSVVDERPTKDGFRFFELTFEQPSDHRDPASPRFRQRVTLLHRGFDRPTVAHTTGYGVPDGPFRSEPARLLDANQISIEHRFFAPSRPRPADWSDLTIWQAATDEHRIIRALDEIYSEKWISTGASKGGMTAIYHRRFYPDDVDGTVAYVAPSDVDNRRDSYAAFLDRVGTEQCRRALTVVQREALQRRGQMLARLSALAEREGLTFDRVVGGIDRALEMTVLDTPFAFWQYRGVADCDEIPAATASTGEIFAFVDETVRFSFYTDQGLTRYVPYYYQAGTQLGSPRYFPDELAGLFRYDDLLTPRNLVPRRIPMRFQPQVMRHVSNWVRHHGERLMFVYGENDPWSAEPFRLGAGTEDSYVYTAPGGNHGSEIAGLPAPQRRTAIATLRRWGDVSVDDLSAGKIAFLPGLDDRRVPRRPL